LNERENIETVLTAIHGVLEAAIPGRYEIIVVDDDSPDGTWQAATRMVPQIGALLVVRRRGERGLASAVIRGWQAGRGEVLGTINADLQHPPEILARMVLAIDGADLVVATRHADGGGLGDWGWARRVASFGAQIAGMALLKRVFQRVSDPLSGCYLVRRAAIQGTELRPVGYKTLIEILARGRVAVIRECGYVMRRRVRGRSKVGLQHHFEYLSHLLRLRSARH
jgi:dolichol-phosphate mannosyltransferase